MTHDRRISVTVYLDPEQKESLDRLHKMTKVPRSVYIRKALNLVMNWEEDEAKLREKLVAADGE